MEHSFWRDRWEAGAIGFHQGQPNAFLSAHHGLLAEHRRVFVPLAGKAVDMAYLAARDHEVVGVELVESACRAFFREQGLPLVEEERPPFHAFAGGGITLLCGDVFDATPARVGQVDAVYDRAALIALHPDDWQRYVDLLLSLVRPGGLLFIITFAYDQTKLAGPPWSVDDATLNGLLAAPLADGRVRSVAKIDSRDEARGPRFVEAGVEALTEALFVVTRA